MKSIFGILITSLRSGIPNLWVLSYFIFFLLIFYESTFVFCVWFPQFSWLMQPRKDSLGIFTPTWFTSCTFLSKDDHRKFVAGTNSHQVILIIGLFSNSKISAEKEFWCLIKYSSLMLIYPWIRCAVDSLRRINNCF